MTKFQRAIILFYCFCCIAEISLLLLKAAEVITWPWIWVNSPVWVGICGFTFVGLYWLFKWDPGEGSPESLVANGATTAAVDEIAAAALKAMAVRQIHMQLDHFDEVILIVRAQDIVSVQSGSNGAPQLQSVFVEVRRILQDQNNIKPLNFSSNGK